MSSAPPKESVVEDLLVAAPPPARTVVDMMRDRATGPDADRPLFTALGAAGERMAHLTPAELDARARAVAAALRRTGRPGDRVIVPPMPGLDFHVAFFGCLYAGMVAVPVADATGPVVAAIARDCRPGAVLVPDATTPGPVPGVPRVAVRGQARASRHWRGGPVAPGPLAPDPAAPGPLAPSSVAPDALAPDPLAPGPAAPALLQYAARTGRRGPAGVVVGHGALVAGQAAVRDRCDVDPGTTVVSWLPLWHGTGLATALVLPLVSGATAVTLEPAAFVRDPRVWLRAIEAEEDVFAAAPDAAYELCVRRVPAAERMRIDLSTWRVAAVGAGGGRPVRARTLHRFADAFRPGFFREEVFAAGYGTGGGALGATLARPLHPTVAGHYDRASLTRGEAVPVSRADRGGVELVGRGTPLPGVGVRVVDPASRRAVPERVVGEIWVDAPGGAVSRTGDLGFFDGGELFVTG
ncbi:AMP-binding protein [Streptomyces sp. TRM76323]|uniref:AMP-binding protein n=1 Tax=Streptomyces tamarix TaxID=3078565 RepID=A0ABU3QQF1_9ACTN|nr:AMP-binding protein [Streptomyces tamarix]MDT9684957.1 AMP-binding protein [Streptomyces tamarix]